MFYKSCEKSFGFFKIIKERRSAAVVRAWNKKKKKKRSPRTKEYIYFLYNTITIYRYVYDKNLKIECIMACFCYSETDWPPTANALKLVFFKPMAKFR